MFAGSEDQPDYFQLLGSEFRVTGNPVFLESIAVETIVQTALDLQEKNSYEQKRIAIGESANTGY